MIQAFILLLYGDYLHLHLRIHRQLRILLVRMQHLPRSLLLLSNLVLVRAWRRPAPRHHLGCYRIYEEEEETSDDESGYRDQSQPTSDDPCTTESTISTVPADRETTMIHIKSININSIEVKFFQKYAKILDNFKYPSALGYILWYL